MGETGEYRVPGIKTGRNTYMVTVTNCRECGQHEREKLLGITFFGGGSTIEWILSLVPPHSHLEEPKKIPLLSQVGRGEKKTPEMLSEHLHSKGQLSRGKTPSDLYFS